MLTSRASRPRREWEEPNTIYGREAVQQQPPDCCCCTGLDGVMVEDLLAGPDDDDPILRVRLSMESFRHSEQLTDP